MKTTKSTTVHIKLTVKDGKVSWELVESQESEKKRVIVRGTAKDEEIAKSEAYDALFFYLRGGNQ